MLPLPVALPPLAPSFSFVVLPLAPPLAGLRGGQCLGSWAPPCPSCDCSWAPICPSLCRRGPHLCFVSCLRRRRLLLCFSWGSSVSCVWAGGRSRASGVTSRGRFADYPSTALGCSLAPCNDCLGCCAASCCAARGAPPSRLPGPVGVPPPLVRLLMGAPLPTALPLSLAPSLLVLSFLVVVLPHAPPPLWPLYQLHLDSWVLRGLFFAHRSASPGRPLLRALSVSVIVPPRALRCCSWCSADAYAWALERSSSLGATAHGRFAAYRVAALDGSSSPCDVFLGLSWPLCGLVLCRSWGSTVASAWALGRPSAPCATAHGRFASYAHEPVHTNGRSAHKPGEKRKRSLRRGRVGGSTTTYRDNTQSRGATKSGGATGNKAPRSGRTKGGGAPTGLDRGDSGAPQAARAGGSTATKKEDTRSRRAPGSGTEIGGKAPKSSRTKDGGVPMGQGVHDVGAPRAAKQEAAQETRRTAPGAG